MTKTRTDPKDMTDAELSEAVAVFMGWRAGVPHLGGDPKDTWRSPDELEREVYNKGQQHPAYASDIAAAMEVFAKVGDDDHPIEHTGEATAKLHRYAPADGEYDWSASFMVTDIEREDFRYVEVISSTAARAICEAALLWARGRG